jgi:hypothetical protein
LAVIRRIYRTEGDGTEAVSPAHRREHCVRGLNLFVFATQQLVGRIADSADGSCACNKGCRCNGHCADSSCLGGQYGSARSGSAADTGTIPECSSRCLSHLNGSLWQPWVVWSWPPSWLSGDRTGCSTKSGTDRLFGDTFVHGHQPTS